MNWPVVERSRDICGYYRNCHEQHAQQVYTSIAKSICSVLKAEVHSNFLP